MANPNSRARRFLPAPSGEEIRRLGARDFLRLSQTEAEHYATAVGSILEMVEALEELPLPRHEPTVERIYDPGYRPSREEDPYNAFIRRCHIDGGSGHELKGLTFAVKDNIDVAGLPTTNGSRSFSFVPSRSATVVERLLQAGATLLGKLNMDDFSGGPTGETSYYGPPRNPTNPSVSAGGSSGGSAAAVAAGMVDFSMAVDQGGSARIPASFCGVTSIKPTHGLVPTFGTFHADHTIDYVCPVARTVSMLGRVLSVIAGSSEEDPQWVRAHPIASDYTAVAPLNFDGLRVGVLDSIKGLCDPDVEANYFHVLDLMKRSGASVTLLGIPLWANAYQVKTVLLVHLLANMLRSEGAGYGHLGHLSEDFMRSVALYRRFEGDSFPAFIKTSLLADSLLHERWLNRSYARAHNLRLELRTSISDAFNEVDVLVTPGTPDPAPPLSSRVVENELEIIAGLGNISYFTCPTNLSGHPSLVIPSGHTSGGLPTSVQFTARHWDEAKLIALGLSLEAELREESVMN